VKIRPIVERLEHEPLVDAVDQTGTVFESPGDVRPRARSLHRGGAGKAWLGPLRRSKRPCNLR
jgi:hypothetical protein